MLKTLYSWYGKRTVKIIGALVIVLLLVGLFINRGNSTDGETIAQLKPVEVASIAQLSNQSTFSLVGTVASRNQADIQTETSGRVTRVNATLGDTVSAGTILFELENASERAAVLSAEGSYEAALAVAAQSNISEGDAATNLQAVKNNAISSYRDAYNTTNAAVLNTLDSFFSDPYANTPGVKIDSLGQATYLNQNRVTLNTTLKNWQNTSLSLDTDDDIQAKLNEATVNVNTVINMFDVLIKATAEAGSQDILNGQPVSSYTNLLVSERARLTGVLSDLNTAKTNLTTATANLERAKISGTQETLSTANAQVKQALGALRSAQANLDKTIVRTPISGTLNEFSVKSGDFVSQQQRVALVANNDALEITTYVGESDRQRIFVGQEVQIEGSITGIITAIAPAIDTVTRKIEVTIATETTNIANGDSVTVTIQDTAAAPSIDGPLLVPITAVKFTSTDGSVFTVEDSLLVSHTVTVGSVRGGYVEILDGVTNDMNIVIDARGLSSGQTVEAITTN